MNRRSGLVSVLLFRATQSSSHSSRRLAATVFGQPATETIPISLRRFIARTVRVVALSGETTVQIKPMTIAIPLLAILSVLFGQTLAPERPKIAEKPNIIVIFTDDHGWAHFAAQGMDLDIRTLQTDQLARDGVRFTRGYVTGPQYVPSRAGLIAGPLFPATSAA